MKKSLLLVAAAVTALFSACSGDELANGNDVVNVSFNASFDQVMPTRGVSGESDGTAATKLYVAVYNKDNQLIKAISKIGVDGSQAVETVSNKQATVSFQLVKGQTYNFVFWAQNPNATADAVVFNPETGKVSVDYTKIKANDESLDAFTAHVNNLTVTGAIAQDVTLKRPWAQVNYGSAQSDWNAAVAAGITVAKSKVTVNNVYKTLNALTGEVEGTAETADIALAANTIPASATTSRTLTVSGTNYKYIGLNYLLVGNEGEQSLIKADLEIQKESGEVINTLTFSNVPVQRNYRTNIVGNLLTSQAQFNITLDSNYEDDITGNNEVIAEGITRFDNVYSVTNAAATSNAINTIYADAKNNGISELTINLTEGDFTLPAALTPSTIHIKGAGINTKLTPAGYELYYDNCTLDFSDLTMVGYPVSVVPDFSQERGLVHLSKETYTNVTFTLCRLFYGITSTFNNCKFNQEEYQYSFCAYRTKEMTFNDCEFSCVGKAAKVYGVDSSNPSTVTFNRCKFTCDGTARQADNKDWKAAIEMDARMDNNTHFTVNINNTIGCTGFYTSENTAIAKTEANYQGTLYNVDSGSGNKIVVNIDGVQQAQAW